MAVQQQSPQQAEEKEIRWWETQSFLESTWISVFTKWFLTFGGKVAQLTLILCTLYMSAELYPGISLPSGLNLAVFVTLSFALDMGGLGLSHIAKTAREQGNDEGAEQGERLSHWLIGIMIAGLVVIALEHAIVGITLFQTKDVKQWVDGFWAIVEIALSILRVVCAVRYGHVVHMLERGLEQNNDEKQVQMEEQSRTIAELQVKVQQGERSLVQAHQDNNRLSQQLTDAENALCRLPRLQEQITEIGQDKQSVSDNLQSAQRTIADLNTKLQTANTKIADLQFGQRTSAHLQNANEELTANVKALQLQNADLTVKLQTAKSRISELQNADRETAKSPANITPIENARSMKNGSARKFTHAEVLEFKASHPTLKNAEVASQLGISERKVYEAIAWQKDQSADENAVEVAR